MKLLNPNGSSFYQMALPTSRGSVTIEQGANEVNTPMANEAKIA